MKKYLRPLFFFASLMLINIYTVNAKDLYINLGKANIKKSVTAVVPMKFLGTPSLAKKYLKFEKMMYDVIRNDLKISSYFSIQDPKGFVESSKKGLRPAYAEKNGFDFSSWKQIGSDFLVKTGYNVINGRVHLEAYVYYVPKKELVFGRSYSSPQKDVRTMTHKLCTDIVKKITGKKSFFMTKIAVARSVNKNTKEIFVMDWDGANQEQITRHRTITMSPSWTPDGRHLSYSAYMSRRKLKKVRNWDLFLYDFKTKRKALLAGAKGINSTATFFPSMKEAIIRIGVNSKTSDFYRVNLQNKRRTPFIKGPRGAMNVEPALSPDGKRLAFSSDRSGKPMIYIQDVGSNKAKRLTFSGRYNSSPAWSPDGTKITYASHANGAFDIYVMDVNGRNQKKLTASKKKNGRNADSEDPSFSPDGRLILFRSKRTGNYQLYAVTVDGKSEYRITYDNYNYYRPQWSPYLE